MNKKELFKKNRAALQIDEDWESIADELAKERDVLKNKIEELKKSPSEIISIDPDLCVNWFYSDRNEFELGDIQELAEDIKRNGQLQPAIVRKVESLDINNKYEVIAGERRWRACSIAGLGLKAIVTDANDAECLVIQTSENKKESLSSYSLAKVYSKIMEDKKISQNNLSELLGIPKASLSNLLSFNKVPEEIWDEVKDMSQVSPKTAAFIVAHTNKGKEYTKAIKSLASHIREGRGVRFLEKCLDKYFSNKKLDRNRTYVQKNEEGNVLFRITENGRITLGDYVQNKYSIEEVKEKLVAALE